jgi:hypothetical protein
MTFKKLNRSSCVNRKEFSNSGQSIFEYFILTAVIVTVVLFFGSSKFFTNPDAEEGEQLGIKEIFQRAFNEAVEEIVK